MKKIVIIALLIGFFGQYGWGQTLIDTKKVPAKVIKKFETKNRGVKEVKWYIFDLEHDYLVKYLSNSLECQIRYDKLGKEISSKKEVELKSLNSKIADDLRKNHKDKKVYKAYLIVKGRKDKYYSVILHKSQGRKKPPLVYDAQYTINGSYLTLYEPEIELEEEEEYKADKYEESMDEDTEDLESVEYDQKIKKDDLPSSVVKYLKKRYDIEYKYKDIRIKKNKKYGEYYYIELKKQGEKKKYIYYFDMYGKMIKEKVVNL
jgi:hypothetical protein